VFDPALQSQTTRVRLPFESRYSETAATQQQKLRVENSELLEVGLYQLNSVYP
jgi:hypothetical protein